MSALRTGWMAAGGASSLSALAGALAERGAAALAWSDGRGWRALEARATDLPGLLAGALSRGETAELSALDRVFRVEIGPGGLRWFTTDGPLADALSPLSSPRND